MIPRECFTQYNLEYVVDTNGWVYTKIYKGVYDLKQARVIANQKLIKYLKLYSYHLVKFTPGLWKHEDKDTLFSLVVNDFSIKSTSEENVQHLLQAFKENYKILVDWKAQIYMGINFKYDYVKRKVDLLMPDYVNNVLAKFQHILSNKLEYIPYAHGIPTYGTRV